MIGISAHPSSFLAFDFDHDVRVTPADERRTMEGAGEEAEEERRKRRRERRRTRPRRVKNLGKVAVNSSQSSSAAWINVQGWGRSEGSYLRI